MAVADTASLEAKGQVFLSDGTPLQSLDGFDWNQHDLIIHVDAASRQTTFDWVNGLIESEASSAKGISPAAPSVSPRLMAILNDDGTGQPIHTVFGGVAVDINSILVKHTWVGDLNLDGLVTGEDFFVMDRYKLRGGAAAANADFDRNGGIDNGDYGLLFRSFAGQSGRLAGGQPVVAQSLSVQAVPLPSAFWGALGLLGGVAVVRRIRRSD